MAKFGYIGLYQAILNDQRIVHRYFAADSYWILLLFLVGGLTGYGMVPL